MLNLTSLLRRVKKPAKNITRVLQFLSAGERDAQAYQSHPNGLRSVSSGMGVDDWRMRTVVLVVLQVSLGLTRESPLNEIRHDVSTMHAIPASFSVLEALKLACGFALVYYEMRKAESYPWYSSVLSSSVEFEVHPLHTNQHCRSGSNESHPQNVQLDSHHLALASTHSNITIGLLAFLLAANSYLTSYIAKSSVNGSVLIQLASLSVPIIATGVLRLVALGTLVFQQRLGVFVQILGILNLESQFFPPNIQNSVALLIPLALLPSLTYVAIHFTYKLHDTSIPDKITIRLFAFGLLLHVSTLIFISVFDLVPASLVTTRPSLHTLIALVLRVFVDIASLNLIASCGVVLFGVSSSLSTTLLLIYSRIMSDSFSLSEFCSLAVALLGFYAYWVGETQEQAALNSSLNSSSDKKVQIFRWLFSTALLAVLGIITITSSNAFAQIVDAHPLSTPESRLSDYTIFAELAYVPVLPEPAYEPICTRAPLPSEQYFTGNRTYHEFDDVLLIVFFSHARYDANLDYYKEVYSEFFPNIVFVGPRNREDKGFEHSYDVLVDSYESDEDISDWTDYKMAGRMAHHMLYTVLTTPSYSTNCYKGFLWAPFDTLLNIPRLQLFDQDRIWYFSPWGEYVPNPAVEDSAWMNASYHAPPARVSPDPETDFNKTFRGWWVDWWWGDPHYGIPVCKFAFERVPLELRDRMASRFTNNATRYIGGSADTLYVPARLADQFVDLLGTFLNTSCFLEIAVPTVVHLLVPKDESILYVDHWWIWNPPFNASFVRDRWRKGMEVDTFHTFHWGDKGPDGEWTAIPENMEDVRSLFRESAARQNVEWLS